MVNSYHRQYAQVQTNTITQEQLLLLMYEGAIKFLTKAKAGLARNDLPTGKTALSRGLAIVTELQNSLDHEAGWAGSRDLSDLYDHMIMELTEVNLHGDLSKLDRVCALLTDLYGTWSQAVKSQEAAAAPASQGATAAVGAGERAPFRACV